MGARPQRSDGRSSWWSSRRTAPASSACVYADARVETEALELSETDMAAALTADADADGDGISDTIIRGLDTVRVVP